MWIASASLWKEQTIRRKDGRGENEFRGAIEEISERIVARVDGWKRERSWRSVIRSVLDGGVGLERGGRLERSSERVGRDERDEVLDVRLDMVGCSVMLAMSSFGEGMVRGVDGGVRRMKG